jgi:hypothetical protein
LERTIDKYAIVAGLFCSAPRCWKSDVSVSQYVLSEGEMSSFILFFALHVGAPAGANLINLKGKWICAAVKQLLDKERCTRPYFCASLGH